MRFVLLIFLLAVTSNFAAAPVDVSPVRREHVMIPMRDGVKLSAYLYFPPSDEAKLPVVFEQRYADISAAATAKTAADFAQRGFIVAMVN
jgi:uncharacterized protein